MVHTGRVRSPAIAGSLAIHCAIALLIVLLLTDEPRAPHAGPRSGAVAIEMVDAPSMAATGGSPRAQAGAPAAAPRQARTAAPRPQGAPVRPASTVDGAVETTMRIDEPADTAAGDDPAGVVDGDLAGEVTGTLAGGGGVGGGRGSGVGLGDGAGLANVADVASLPLPMPPRVSLARPPVLIWPKKEGPIVESELYVARLQIDSDGLVAGVRLVRRFREPRDDNAEDAVWKFRYLPALDDDGHPVRATIEQPFMLHVR
jgi:hypothetical protein